VGQQLACAEVELVHAGNEYQQQGWRHAKPYIQMAEDLIAAAELGARDCPKFELPPEPTGAGPKCEEKKPEENKASCAPGSRPPQKEVVVLGASMLFEFDGRQEKHLRRAGLAQFDQLIARLQADYGDLQRIEVIGYTDRLGKPDYNLKLSQDRAEVIKAYLVRKGIDASRIVAKGMGQANPVKECVGTRQTPQLTECLEPNRRVELIINGVKLQP
jgi:outer membrane protein OmpA-like peptidoglycan-associated protein